MASKLLVYQEALEALGERRLATITEDREPRYILDQAWSSALNYCLEQGFWNFALRSSEFTPDDGVETSFGYTYAYSKPSDWLRTYTVSEDETFLYPTDGFIDENGYWFANASTLYVRYLSNDASYGGNLAAWPQTFATYVATHLARRVCRRLTNSQDLFETLFKLEKIAKTEAAAHDAMNEGPRRIPSGTWVRSRNGGTSASRWSRTFR